jgi:dTDP-4-amino-4,6-dideoxygalactose transaminase
MESKKIYYGKQHIDNQDINEVTKALKNNLITGGKYVKKFENSCKKRVNSKFAYSCNSGTSAILLAYLAIGLKKNDVIIMPALNFVAAANMAKLLKARIYFADIDYLTGQITPEKIIDCIKINKIKKIKVILTMYLGGYPRLIKEFYYLKKKLKCFLIEDACHAFGAKYILNKNFYSIGSCKHSDICTFSFHPLKPITTGEGGLVTTNSKIIAKKIELFRSHGIIRKSTHWDYSVQFSGYNFRLSDINSALGYSQLKKIDKFFKKRKFIYNFYQDFFNKFSFVKIIRIEKHTLPSFHLVIALIDFSKMKIDKNFFLKVLKSKNIFCQYHYIPIPRFKEFESKKFFYLKNTIKYYNNAVSLPIYNQLTNKDLRRITEEIISTLKKNLI